MLLASLTIAATSPLAAALESWQWHAVLRMLMCLVIGGAVGLEREYHGRAAGFRTHILVCLGCCVIMLASTHFARLYEHLDVNSSVVRVDPARMAYGVVTGIGFLGAGVILRTGVTVHGLTTAASLWSVAALGLATGLGMYTVATFGAILTLITLVSMRQVGVWVQGHHYRVVRVTAKDTDDRSTLHRALEGNGAKILRSAVDHRCAEGLVVATYSLRFPTARSADEVHQIIEQAGSFERIEVE